MNVVPAIIPTLTVSYMDTENIRLYDLTDIHSTSETFTEIKKIVSLVDPSFDSSLIENTFNDIILLFKGKFPGYRSSNTKYHTWSIRVPSHLPRHD